MRVVSISVRGARGMFSAPWLVPVIGGAVELQALLDAVSPAAMHRRHREVRIDVGAGAARFEPRRLRAMPAITRKLAVRLSMPQVGLTGAQKPSTSRL